MGRKKVMTPEAKAILQKQKMLSKLRAKVEKGTATEEEIEQVRQAPPPKLRGRRVTKMRAAEASAAADSPETFTPGEAETAGAEPVKPPAPPPLQSTVAAVGKGYDSRQEACREVANAYCTLLVKLSDYIKDNGATPFISPEMINETVLPAAIQVADRLLPADLEITPEFKVVAFSGVTLGQAAYVAAKKKKSKGQLQSVPAMPIPFKTSEPEQPNVSSPIEESVPPSIPPPAPQPPRKHSNLWPNFEV